MNFDMKVLSESAVGHEFLVQFIRVISDLCAQLRCQYISMLFGCVGLCCACDHSELVLPRWVYLYLNIIVTLSVLGTN